MLRYQIADIDALKLREGEEEAAEKERDRLLNLEKIPKPDDAADALAMAICHCHSAGSLIGSLG